MKTTPQYMTDKPLVVFGATGMLASQLVFMACLERFTPYLILHGANLDRLQGLRAEVLESGFAGINVEITTSAEEACARGGYIFYSRSVRSGVKTREAMLLDNAPAAVETAQALAKVSDKVERVVVVTNPSDVIALTLLVHSQLSSDKVCALSALDTMRYHVALRSELPPMLQNATLEGVYTLGSHDMAMAVMRDTVRVDGMGIDELIARGDLTEEQYALIKHRVINGGRIIIKQRGHTAYQSPAYLGYKILKATDSKPFTLPTSRYHNSQEFAHCFFSLPTQITTQEIKHLPLLYSARDREALQKAYESVQNLRDILIQEDYLPPISTWRSELQLLSPSDLIR